MNVTQVTIRRVIVCACDGTCWEVIFASINGEERAMKSMEEQEQIKHMAKDREMKIKSMQDAIQELEARISMEKRALKNEKAACLPPKRRSAMKQLTKKAPERSQVERKMRWADPVSSDVSMCSFKM